MPHEVIPRIYTGIQSVVRRMLRPPCTIQLWVRCKIHESPRRFSRVTPSIPPMNLAGAQLLVKTTAICFNCTVSASVGSTEIGHPVAVRAVQIRPKSEIRHCGFREATCGSATLFVSGIQVGGQGAWRIATAVHTAFGLRLC